MLKKTICCTTLLYLPGPYFFEKAKLSWEEMQKKRAKRTKNTHFVISKLAKVYQNHNSALCNCTIVKGISSSLTFFFLVKEDYLFIFRCFVTNRHETQQAKEFSRWLQSYIRKKKRETRKDQKKVEFNLVYFIRPFM